MAKLVLLAIAERHVNGADLFPSRETIAADIGIDRELNPATITRALNVLEERGLISKSQATRSGRRSTNKYVLHLDRVTPVQRGPCDSCATPRELQINLEHPIATLSARPNLVRTYVDQAKEAGWEPSERFKARVGKEAKELREDGKSDDLIIEAITVLAKKHRSPAALPGIVGEIESIRSGHPPNGKSPPEPKGYAVVRKIGAVIAERERQNGTRPIPSLVGDAQPSAPL